MQSRIPYLISLIALLCIVGLKIALSNPSPAVGASGKVWVDVLIEGNASSDTTNTEYLDLSDAYAWLVYANLTGHATPVYETRCYTRTMATRHYDCTVYTQYRCTVYTKYGCTIKCEKSGTGCSTTSTTTGSYCYYDMPTCTTSGQGESPSCSCQRYYHAEKTVTVSCDCTYLLISGLGGIHNWGSISWSGKSQASGGSEKITCSDSDSYDKSCCEDADWGYSGCHPTCPSSWFPWVCETDSIVGSCSTGWSSTCTPGTRYYVYVMGGNLDSYCDPCDCVGASGENTGTCQTTLAVSCYYDPDCSSTVACPAPSASATSAYAYENYKVIASYTISPDTSCTGVCPSGWTLTQCSDCVCNKNPQTQNTGSTPCGSYSGCDCDKSSCVCNAGAITQNTGPTPCGSHSGCYCDDSSCSCKVDSWNDWTETVCSPGEVVDPCTGACAPGGSCDTNDLKQCDADGSLGAPKGCWDENIGTDYPDYPELNVSTTQVFKGGVDFQQQNEINLTDYLSATNNEIRIYGGTTGEKTEYKIYGRKQVTGALKFVELQREQDPNYYSSLEKQYFRKPYNLTNNYTYEATDISWEGECDYGTCTSYSGIVSSLDAGQSMLVYVKWYADNLTESWSDWYQYPNNITYAGGLAWVSKNLTVDNGDSVVTFTNVQYSTTGRSGWDCYQTSGYIDVGLGTNSYSDLVYCSKSNVIRVTTYIQAQEPSGTGEKVRWWINDTWKNEDPSVTFRNITKVYTLPSDCSDVRVFVDGVEQTTNTSMVLIEGCKVTVFNITLAPGESVDPDITYLTPEVTKEEGSYTPDGTFEVDKPAPWKKYVYVRNQGSETYSNISVNASIPISTYEGNITLRLYKKNEAVVDEPWNFTANISGGYINWTIDSIGPYENQTWEIKFNTTAPSLTQVNETNDYFASWINVTGAVDIDYPNVHASIPIGNVIREQTHFYDNTTGEMIDIMDNSSYGPPSLVDTDGDYFYDKLTWIVPTIPANNTTSFFLNGTRGKGIVCQAVNKTIVNAPISSGENVLWNWTVVCPNDNPIDVNIGNRPIQFSIPLDAFGASVDGTAVDILFGTYGTYVELPNKWERDNNVKTVIPAHGSLTFYVSFRTTAITKVEQTVIASEQWVGEKTLIKKIVEIRNWGEENLTNISEPVEIGYGENLRIYEDGELVTTVPEVTGSYILDVPLVLPKEIKKFVLYYEVDTAELEEAGSYRDVINGTLVQVTNYRILASSPIPLTNLKVKIRIYPACYKVVDVWEIESLASKEPLDRLTYECSDRDLIINIGKMPVGGVKYIRVFVETEEPIPEYRIPGISEIFSVVWSYIYNFLSSLLKMIGDALQALFTAFK